MPSEIKANELHDVDVSLISLVKRGANRIPFRFTKKDGQMIDFNRIFARKADEDEAAKKAVIVKDAASAVPGTMPIPTTPEAAVAAATAILKENGYSVMLASAEQVTSAPAAKDANGADKAAAAVDTKKAEGQDAQSDKDEEAEDKALAKVAAKKAEIEKASAELVELEKAVKSTPAAMAAKVNASAGKEDLKGTGVKDANGSGPGGDGDEEISEDSAIHDEAGHAKKKALLATVAKEELAGVTKAIADLAALVKASTEATETRLKGVEAQIKKTDATMVAKVLGGAPGDETPANVRKAASSAPPLLDTGMATSGRR